MIRQDKFSHSIEAIREVIVLARKLAYDGTEAMVIAELLDRAEYLPRLVLEKDDKTEEFRNQIVEIAREFSWQIIVDHFDEH